MKVKPSAEQLVDADEKPVLALVWTIMLKHIKIADPDTAEIENARDALLAWIKKELVSYPEVPIESFKKSFNDGLAICALLHKYRPKSFSWDKLSKDNPIDNLKVVGWFCSLSVGDGRSFQMV